MVMTTNDALLKHNFVSKISLKSESGELSKGLKVKVMSMRIELGKVRKEFDADLKEFSDTIVTDDVRELAMKQDKTEEETKQLEEFNTKLNDEYQTYIQERLNKEVDIKKCSISEDEYEEIIGAFDMNDVEINGQKLSPEAYLEALYEILVKND